MRETRLSGSEGGARFNPLSLPYPKCVFPDQWRYHFNSGNRRATSSALARLLKALMRK